MRLRTFTAPDMPTAMRMVRDALGDDAIILSSEPNKGKKGLTVTAAMEGKDEPIFPTTTQKPAATDNSETDHLRFEIQNILRFHNVPDLFLAKMMQKIPSATLSSVLAQHRMGGNQDEKHLFRLSLEKMADTYFLFDPIAFENHDLRLMLIGPPGVGKTLTIAKMAAHLTVDKKLQKKPKLAVITTDTKRAGGVEQLQAFTNILGIELHIAATPAELSEHIGSLPPHTQVLIDTAGCNPYDQGELRELKAMAIKSVEPLLVLPAGGDSLETIDMVEAFSTMLVKRLLITRIDTARRLGSVLAAAAAHELSFCEISTSSSIVDRLQSMDASLLARLLLRYQLQSQ